MSIQVALNHRTQYRYDKAVSIGPQVIRLRPAPHCRTPILSYSLSVTPPAHLLNWQLDAHNNHLARLLFPDKTNEFVVEVDLVAELSPFNPFDFFLEPGVENYPFDYAPDLAKDLEPYRSVEPAGPSTPAFLRKLSREKQGTISFLVDLNRRVRDEIGYVTRLDPGVQTCEQTLEKRTGSCRDSAWLLVQILRHLGIAARFVSGYLIQLAADERRRSRLWTGAQAARKPTPPTSMPGRRRFCPVRAGLGWIRPRACLPVRVTSRSSARRMLRKAAPIGGTVEPANVDFSYSMSIRRLNDAPRPSKPFTEEDWLQGRTGRASRRRGLGSAGCAPDHGRRADLRRHGRAGEPAMEHRCSRTRLSELRGLALIRCLREKTGARRTASLRARQVVSRRTVAALGAELLLARRRCSGNGRISISSLAKIRITASARPMPLASWKRSRTVLG
jgi:hypothetical protein